METLYTDRPDMEVAALTSPAEVEEVIILFENIAREQGWRPGNQLRAHLDRSAHFALTAHGSAVGGIQLVRGCEGHDLPLRALWPEVDPGDLIGVAHVTVMALQKEYRGKNGLFWLLCVELWRYCVEKGISRLYLEVTPTTLRLYRRIGWPLVVVGSLRLHWGEECYLCSMDVGELAGIFIFRAQRSAVYRQIVSQGLHLSAAARLTNASK